LSHELVHHAQNCRGEFDKTAAMGEGYAQADEHLREMEREAYEKGNLIFRDFTDGLKSNDEEITIYIDDSTDNESANLHEEKKMKKNKLGLKSPHPKWQAFLLGESSDSQKQQWMQAFQNAAGNPQPPPQDFWDTATYLHSKGGDPVEAGRRYADNNKWKENPMMKEGDSPKKDMGATGEDARWLPESYGEDDDYFDALEAEFPFLSKAVKAGEVPQEVAVDIAKEYGSEGEMPSGEDLKQSLREIVKRSMTTEAEYLANFKTYKPTRIGTAQGGAVFYENPIRGDEDTVLAVYDGKLWDTGDYEVPDDGDMHFWKAKVWKSRHTSAAPMTEKLSGDQEELDQDKDGDIGADDLANLRSKKK